MDAKTYVQGLIDRARTAQRRFETYSQEQVDQAVRAIGKAIFDHGEELAKMAVDETGMGVYSDKIIKNKVKAKAVWNKLKHVKSRGIIRYIEHQGLVEVAKPIGVIGAVTPTTNPTMTPMQNAMIALKGGNALIVCPHPRAKRTGEKTVAYMREALNVVGAPEDLIQFVPEPAMEISAAVMAMCDTCISTGGPGMVKAAFSSGRPAFGVGAGNVQALIDRDAPLEAVVPMLIKGRTYDNGILCTCEQAAICPEEKFDELLTRMKASQVYCVERADEVEALRRTMFFNGTINKDVVGNSPVRIAAMAGISVPEDTKMLLVCVEKWGGEELLAKEKLCPVQVAYRYKTWEEAVEIARQNLLNEGTGHSAVLHSYTKAHIEYAAEQIPVSRFVVNQVGSSGLGGAFNNELNPTATLGCGSWGNNSISENLWWHHLVNISRIAYIIPEREPPTDEEVWGD
jgi:succinate-semialdehyde dehydrogenase